MHMENKIITQVRIFKLKDTLEDIRYNPFILLKKKNKTGDPKCQLS